MDLAAPEAWPGFCFAASFQLKAQAKCQIEVHAVNNFQNLNLNYLHFSQFDYYRLKVSHVFIPTDFSV